MKPDTRDNLNLALTIIGVCLIPLCGAYFKSELNRTTAEITGHSDSNVAGLKQSITENYETRSDHAADTAKISEWNKSLAQGQKDLAAKVDLNNVEQRLAIQHLGDKLDTLSNKKNP